MKKVLCLYLLFFLESFAIANDTANWISPTAEPTNSQKPTNSQNQWAAFRTVVKLEDTPKSEVIAKIAVDSKYWLWINGNLVVFEGGLKRGPNPSDGYFDQVDISKYLNRGENKIAILVWYFGKNGFSHKSSGKLGLFFEAVSADGLRILSGTDWLARIHPAYSSAMNPPPNFRLSESNIKFDAQKDITGWQVADNLAELGFKNCLALGSMGAAPWNSHQKRPIPLWKDYGIESAPTKKEVQGEYIITNASLPYNMQFTPIIELNDPVGGNVIDIRSDHTVAGGDINVRAEYVTKKGTQTYESLGWINGQKIMIKAPKCVDIKSVKYRQTGYNTEIIGEFLCDDDFFNLYYKKAARTLYVNMRDNYFDCPDRERAQWMFDVSLLICQSFYFNSTSSIDLSKKAYREFFAWQKPNGTLFSPIPAGAWDKELPGQMLFSIGKYGLWNYYMNTGDIQTLEFAYDHIKRYLKLWKLDDDGLTSEHKGNWTWGDWGDNRDIRLMYAAWHYMTLSAVADMADIIGKPDDASQYRKIMQTLKVGFNRYWNGTAYRHSKYEKATDDRVQALAVISGLADESKYDAIYKIFENNMHASPGYETFVMEALFKMQKPEFAMDRVKKRFSHMVMHKDYSTLFEGWEVGTFGGGSTNHSWGGGPVFMMAKKICGIEPIEAGWKTFKIEPNPVNFKKVYIKVPSISGMVESAYEVSEACFNMNVSVPAGTNAVVYLPNFANGKIEINGSDKIETFSKCQKYKHQTKRTLVLPSGKYNISVSKK